MQLQEVHNLHTLFTETTAGTCACLILPSQALSRESTSRCRICERTGKLPRQRPEPSFLRFTTLLEMNWKTYRDCAHKNFDRLRATCKFPTIKGSLADILSLWMKKLPKDVELCKVFYGGDVFAYDELVCILEAARRNPEKVIYMQTGKHNCLGLLEDQIYKGLITLPDNLIIGMEMQCTCLLPLSHFMRVNYTNDPAADIDKSFFPEANQTDVHLQLSPMCVEAFRKREPFVMALAHPINDYKPNTDDVY